MTFRLAILNRGFPRDSPDWHSRTMALGEGTDKKYNYFFNIIFEYGYCHRLPAFKFP